MLLLFSKNRFKPANIHNGSDYENLGLKDVRMVALCFLFTRI